MAGSRRRVNLSRVLRLELRQRGAEFGESRSRRRRRRARPRRVPSAGAVELSRDVDPIHVSIGLGDRIPDAEVAIAHEDQPLRRGRTRMTYGPVAGTAASRPSRAAFRPGRSRRTGSRACRGTRGRAPSDERSRFPLRRRSRSRRDRSHAFGRLLHADPPRIDDVVVGLRRSGFEQPLERRADVGRLQERPFEKRIPLRS